MSKLPLSPEIGLHGDVRVASRDPASVFRAGVARTIRVHARVGLLSFHDVTSGRACSDGVRWHTDVDALKAIGASWPRFL
ncbi:MAG: hypothetical protein PVJ55_10990 [Anaerolineae bacterium]